MKLNDIINRDYPLDKHGRGNLLMRESIRIRQRKLLRESKAPQTGAYWWVPKPTETNSVTWGLVEFYDEHYNGNTLHLDLWDSIIELLAMRWHKDQSVLKRQLGNNYTGLPRGRVNKIIGHNNQAAWTIVHGNDSPKPVEGVANAFNLRLPLAHGRVAFYFDIHEQMDVRDCRRLQKALGTGLGLKGVDFKDIMQ